jgi:CheY-like chemotaxis protein
MLSGESGDPRIAVLIGAVGQAGGRVLIDSTLGRGTTFLVDLPPARAAEPGPRPPVRRGSETVLVVEDDEGIRSWVHTALEDAGYRVLDAANGVEGSVLLREKRGSVDLLLIDALLPGRSGLEIIAEARAADPVCRVLLMTGYSAELVGSEVAQQVPMLEKPFTTGDLLDRVREMLG